jgi:hypothetical protein
VEAKCKQKHTHTRILTQSATTELNKRTQEEKGWTKRSQHLHTPDEGADGGSLNVVQRLNGSANLALVAANINNEGESVVVLHLLEGGLGHKGVLDDSVLVQLVAGGEGRTQVLGVAGLDQSLGATESDRSADLGRALVSIGLDSLGSLSGLGDGGLLGSRGLLGILLVVLTHLNGQVVEFQKGNDDHIIEA